MILCWIPQKTNHRGKEPTGFLFYLMKNMWDCPFLADCGGGGEDGWEGAEGDPPEGH